MLSAFFYNHWNLSTYTLSILSGEEFVSLWELKASSGLSISSTFMMRSSLLLKTLIKLIKNEAIFF
jgi:hypothetical protein